MDARTARSIYLLRGRRCTYCIFLQRVVTSAVTSPREKSHPVDISTRAGVRSDGRCLIDTVVIILAMVSRERGVGKSTRL
jgi:hypothetical protein